MRRFKRARPAKQGFQKTLAFAAIFATFALYVSSQHAVLAQDLLAPPPGAITSGEEDGEGEMHAPAMKAAPTQHDKQAKSPPAPNANAATAPAAKRAPTTAKSTPAKRAGTAQQPTQVAAHTGGNDIYDQWAAKKLKNSHAASNSRPHPLALDHPDDFVVVCEAGCRNMHAQIVYLEPRDARGPVYETPKENTEAETDFVACVGGCYKNGANIPLYNVEASSSSSGANAWLTTTSEAAPAAESLKTGDRWYKRINGPKAGDGGTESE